MKPILRLPIFDQGLQRLLDVLRPEDWAGLECSAELLDLEDGWEDLLDGYGMPLVSLVNLIPANVSRYLAEAGRLARQAMNRHLKAQVERAAAVGVQRFCLDVGADRTTAGPEEETTHDDLMEARAQVFRVLVEACEPLGMTCCIPRRVPSYRMAEMADHAAILMQRVNHANCRLALNVYLDELKPDFQPDRLLGYLYPYLGMIRLHYEPGLGQALRAQTLVSWEAAINQVGAAIPIILCPGLRDVDLAIHEIGRLRGLLSKADDDSDHSGFW